MTALKKGFTLIELLIVIAILGVLAVVVLVAINPVQQLARTRDAGRISTVQQLGHAVEAYFVSHDGTYPTAAWDTELVASGDLAVFPSVVTNTLTTGCGGTNDWCYASATDSFAVWSALESDTNLTVDATCGGTAAYAAYLSLAGRGCIVCDAPPTATSTIAACDN
jgi:prepilin-type N-terminal cleavage/methylation domain-containing protein